LSIENDAGWWLKKCLRHDPTPALHVVEPHLRSRSPLVITNPPAGLDYFRVAENPFRTGPRCRSRQLTRGRLSSFEVKVRGHERFRVDAGLNGLYSFLFDNYAPLHEQFRELALKHGLAVTHQRQVVYEAVIASHGHYSPEDIYAAVRRRVPSVSLATVYNNLRLFIECGLLREVSPHAPTLRVDGNLKPHHHLVCSRCKSVQDIEGDFINFNRLSRQVPDGFDLTQPLVEVLASVRRCRSKE